VTVRKQLEFLGIRIKVALVEFVLLRRVEQQPARMITPRLRATSRMAAWKARTIRVRVLPRWCDVTDNFLTVSFDSLPFSAS
jgi:hypothetical protein